ncbi:flagellar hook-length control protein FliK [Xylophilus sp. GW821-FHT01B05]
MAIETPPAASAAPTRSVRSEGARTDASRVAAGTDNAFASLLGAAEEEESTVPEQPADTRPGSGRSTTVATGTGTATDAVAPDAAALAGAQAVADAAGAELAQAARGTGTATSAADGSALARVGTARHAAAQTAQAATAATATIAGTDSKAQNPVAAELPADTALVAESDARATLASDATGVRAGAADAARRTGVAEGRDTAKAAGSARSAAGTSGYNSILAQMQHAMSRGSAAAAAADSSSTVATAALAAKASTGSASDLRLADRATGEALRGVATADAAPLQALAAAFDGAGGAGARGDRHAAAGDSGTSPGTAAPGGFGSSADAGSWRSLSAASSTDASAAAGTTASPEDQVADQIRYWVNQKTQSAELTLDAFGGVPVDVRISLSGSEAHVAFRSDQAETRQMLGSAEAELRDMLQREGLTLSGLSVGNSDARGAGSGSPDARENGGRSGRQTILTAVEAVATSAPRATGIGTGSGPGRSLDLFV